ncbi:MurR/RpiR family transcriptional regulator [Spiroplasma floricola]|uniref:HTH rpiR-type domain-containing protein n=1 Tax=Spiroplasma floricola 23-6 TaxID=1336749 RepID=A0A2K8SE15_9MOLU|nr:MurR/RpiR family transcriptional regulator [Spiroplasma floricola]AUB31689.1 hypothetical protein SFLOR_v1c06390 [Spiroplasma floricola 23-6]
MTSVFEKLEIMSKDFEDTTFKIIAKKIIENTKNGKFYNQEELANQTFVSISTLTKFSKKLGFSSYREFIFVMKTEWSKYNWDRQKKVDTGEIFESIQTWINRNENFINNICEEIKNFNIINIYSSYQSYDCSKYFANLLIDYGKNVVLLNNEFRFKPRQTDEKSFNLIILTGRDNDTLIDNFSKSYNERDTNFLIATEKQADKLEFNFTNKILIDYSLDNSQVSTRVIALNVLFFTIFNKL